MALGERQKLILKAIVDDYIATAEPVGSKSLMQRNNFDISSATIRNEMAELEENGYLIHPHTSAGRIPTDKGYREYVDSLITIPEMTKEETWRAHEFFKNGFEEITQLLRQASHALSQNTGYTSLTLTPRLHQSQLKQVKMLMIEPGRVLMVVVLGEGVVKDRLVRVPDMLDANQISQISMAIEEGLTGMPLEDITFITVATAGKRTSVPESLLNQILYETYVSIKQADNIGVFMEGSNKILGYPEFTDIKKARNFMDTIAKHGMIAGYMDEVKQEFDSSNNPGSSENNWNDNDSKGILENKSINNDGRYKEAGSNEKIFKGKNSTGTDQIALIRKKPYMIRIGQEIALTGLNDCSFVTTSYKIGGKVVGSIGVLGPKRMEYGKVISQINYVRMAVNSEIRKLSNNKDTMEENLK